MTAFAADQIGSWSYLIVISVYVFDRTHSTQWLAILTLCSRGPCLLLCSYGGVLADRYQRVTVLIVSGLANTVLIAEQAVNTENPLRACLPLDALIVEVATRIPPLPPVTRAHLIAAAGQIRAVLGCGDSWLP